MPDMRGADAVLVDITVPPCLSAVPLVRRAFREAVERVGNENGSDAAHDLMTVVTELTSNAARHAGHVPGDLRARGLLSPDGVRVEVHDHCRAEPRRLEPADPYAERGRGLGMIAALSAKWGSHPTPDGKAVWALVPWRIDAIAHASSAG